MIALHKMLLGTRCCHVAFLAAMVALATTDPRVLAQHCTPWHVLQDEHHVGLGHVEAFGCHHSLTRTCVEVGDVATHEVQVWTRVWTRTQTRTRAYAFVVVVVFVQHESAITRISLTLMQKCAAVRGSATRLG